jgi:hypothetical protein
MDGSTSREEWQLYKEFIPMAWLRDLTPLSVDLSSLAQYLQMQTIRLQLSITTAGTWLGAIHNRPNCFKKSIVTEPSRKSGTSMSGHRIFAADLMPASNEAAFTQCTIR